jgi:triacylglycerol esterase/lipase EstA (alpha/beta hydrolase family)
MKKIIIILVFILTSSVTFGQSMFDKLEDLDEVSAVVVTKDAFDLLRKFPDAQSKDMKIFNTAKGLKELKVFSTENMSIASDMEKMVNSAIKSGKMTQLVRVKDKGNRVKIYIKSSKNKDIVNEVLMFVKSNKSIKNNDKPSSTVISLLGEINMNELAEIANDYEKKK